jgi:hypothetical protein
LKKILTAETAEILMFENNGNLCVLRVLPGNFPRGCEKIGDCSEAPIVKRMFAAQYQGREGTVPDFSDFFTGRSCLPGF